MPLLDPFRPPLSEHRSWESFLTSWVVALCDRINAIVPRSQYFAEVQARLGSRVEADVSEFDNRVVSGLEGNLEIIDSLAEAALVMPAVYPDVFEVALKDGSGGEIRVVAVIELVSPGNKDRPATRKAFAAKCAAYLQGGIGVMVVDIVTERTANLHNELIDAMMLSNDYYGPGEPIYTASYHPVRRDSKDGIDVWLSGLHVGGDLPTMPLFLRGGPVLGIPLDETYARARRGSRL